MYHFITKWYFNAPIDLVWQEIEDTSNISRWLTDFRKVSPRNVSTGNLIGRGKWVLETQGQGTSATYFWDVTVANHFFALFVKLPLFKAITEKNHNATMDRAYQALKQKLQA